MSTHTEPQTKSLTAIFGDIDRMDATAFASYLTEDCTLRFANAPEVTGREAIEEVIAGFFTTIGGLSHEIVDHWQVDDVAIFQIEVTYTRKDGGVVTLPASVIQRFRDGKIGDYRIFIDQTPLYA